MVRRTYGTGSVYQDARGRWIAALPNGWTKRGTRDRTVRVAKTRREANQILATLQRQERATEATTTTTVKTYADTWLPRVQQHLRPASLMVTTAALRWIVPTIGHRRLDRLTPGDIRAVSKAILDAELAPSTASRYRGVLAKMLKDARLDGHAVPGVVDDVEGVPSGESTRGAISIDHVLLILATISARPDRSRWEAALLQGMRPAEVLGLTWDRVDLEERVLNVSWQLQALPYLVARDRTSGFKVPVGYVARQLDGRWHLVRPKTKSGERYIPMVSWLVDSLREWRSTAPPSPHWLVWPDHGRPADPKADRAAWRAICSEAGVPAYDLYACRHTTATLLREEGVTDEVITAIVGHSSIASTRPYIHVRVESLRPALTAVAARLGMGTPALP